jgi:hypothetical protein
MLKPAVLHKCCESSKTPEIGHTHFISLSLVQILSLTGVPSKFVFRRSGGHNPGRTSTGTEECCLLGFYAV